MEKLSKRPPARKTQNLSGPNREVMDIFELAEYLGIGKSKIYALIRAKKIPASRIGRQYRFAKTIIDSWLKEQLITQSRSSQEEFFEAAFPISPK